MRETVVLVHGLWLAGWSMALLARPFRPAGFDVRLYTYPSVGANLEQNADRLSRYVQGLAADAVHFVGHSLGGVVIRALFHYAPPRRPGRAVTIVSPHGGSYVAATLSRYRLGRAVVGRSVADLVAGLAWPPSGREIGVIRGQGGVGLGRVVPGLARPNDGVLTLAEMTLADARDTITLDRSHSAMLLAPEVGRQACYFVQHGTFDRAC